MRSSLLSAAVIATLLAGCGGGGSSTSTPIPPANGAPVSPQDVAQNAADAAFSPIAAGEADSVGAGALGIASHARSTLSIGHGCLDRTTKTVTVNPDGSITTEVVQYYDAACTQPERDAVAVQTTTGGTITITRTITTYNLAHAQLGVRKQTYTLTGSTTNGSWTVTSAFYPGTATTPLSQFAHAATLSAGAYNATTARLVNDAAPSIDASYGHQVVTNATVGTDASGDTTYTGTRNGTSFKGALGALSLSSAPPFTVSGGTQLGTSALTGTVAFNADGDLASINATGTIGNGDTLSIASSTDANGVVAVTGSVTSPAGAPVATFTTDADGNGVLTLVATGTQVPIVDWHVVWA